MKIQPTLTQGARQLGISLIECVVYLAVFMVILSLSFMGLHRTWKTYYVLQNDARDVAAALHAGEQWRADIRNAAGPIEVSQASDDWLIQIPSRHGPIIYRLAAGDLRREIPGKANSVVLGNVRESTMRADRRSTVAAWRWELELKPRTPKGRVRPLFTFMAVPPTPSL